MSEASNELNYDGGWTGWKQLVDPIVATCAQHGVEILQIKEKFGRLRIYVRYPTTIAPNVMEDIDEMIAVAEKTSGHTCEQCGAEGQVRDGSWLKTLCDKHWKEWQEQS